MKDLHDPGHPLWPTLRYVVGMLGITTILWVNASDFDMTEGKSLILCAILFGGWEVAERFLRGSKPEE